MTSIRIDNMHCGACVRRVTAALNALPDTQVKSVEVGAARIESPASPQAVIEAIAKAGFPAYVEPA